MKQGQSLIEMIVIIGIVIVLTTGIIAATTTSLRRTQDSQIRSKALGFAEEGIELTRQKRDSGWATFELMGGVSGTSYCVGPDGVFDIAAGSSCPTYDIESMFSRMITLTLLDSGDPTNEKMAVDVYVKWNNPLAQNTTVTLQTYLTEWR